MLFRSTPGTSAELLGSLGTAGQGCASQLLDAQRAAAGANRTLADRASLNCAVAETAGWLRGRLAGLPAHDAAGRSDLVARDLGEALEAAQSIAFQSNLVESLALLGTLDDARSISLSLWGSAPVISPSKLVSQRRLTAHPNRCAGEAPELDKRSAGSPAGSRVLPAWNLTAHDAAVLIAQEMTVQVLKEGVKAAPIWATGCGARLAAPVRLDADGA